MIRVFTAIQFPIETKQVIEKSIAPLASEVGDRTVRWVEASLYHLTVKFLGDIKESQLSVIFDVHKDVAGEQLHFQLEVGGFGVFPSVRKPRVLWVGLDEKSGALASLKSALERGLEPHGFEVERRKFHPHITVGRVRRRTSNQDMAALSSAINHYEVGELANVQIDRIELVQSELTPSGPIYSTLQSFQLGDG